MYHVPCCSLVCLRDPGVGRQREQRPESARQDPRGLRLALQPHVHGQETDFVHFILKQKCQLVSLGTMDET